MRKKIKQQSPLDDLAVPLKAGKKPSPVEKTHVVRGKEFFGEFWGKNAKHELYGMWSSMKDRCEGKTCKDYHRYGGRGIFICERWKHFPNFVEDMSPRPKGMSIHRIDNDDGYYPGNCKWATIDEQCENKRTNHYLEHAGQKLTVSQWSIKTGLDRSTINQRIRLGWSVAKVLTEPSTNRRPSPLRKLSDSQVAEIRKSNKGTRSLAKEFGVGRSTIKRVRIGQNYCDVNK